MKQQDLINRLRDELTHIVAQTEGNSAMGLTDHNKIAENLVCGIARQSSWQARVNHDGKGSRGFGIMPLMIVAGKLSFPFLRSLINV